jgi:hypothetical protein
MHVKRRQARNLAAFAAGLVATLALAAPASADPPSQVAAGTPANWFARNYQGCLGPLRSAIARGDLAGVVLPSGLVVPAGFSRDFNPGDHFGTVAEANFLTQAGGIVNLAAFCAAFK